MMSDLVSSGPPKQHLSPEQLAIAEEKRLKRQAKKLQQRRNTELIEKPQYLERQWVSLLDPAQRVDRTHTVKLMTWNVLAQCLVRSELFPTSGKARKASERERMIHGEVVSYDADILCLQEVDRLDRLLPVLESAGYSHSYATGPAKSHGCLIAYKRDTFQKMDEKVIYYDAIEVRKDPAASPLARIASSHRTRNIGLILALERIGSQRRGYIVATTHLFWHPAYTYERARQAGILLSETTRWRDSLELLHWPCIIMGDFNFPPDDPVYSLLVSDPLSPEQQHRLDASRVVHVSIDPTVPKSTKAELDEGEEGDPDRVIRNSRVAQLSDGLLSNSELTELFPYRLRSAYEEGQRTHRAVAAEGEVATFGDRLSLQLGRSGSYEPMWTSYTQFWKTTLDYIFFLDSSQSTTEVIGYLQPHRTEDVVLGLPQLQICGSDHFSLCAQLSTSSSGDEE